jgi:hypothetical protein
MWLCFGAGALVLVGIWWIYLAVGRDNLPFVVLVTFCGLLVVYLGFWARRIAKDWVPPITNDF